MVCSGRWNANINFVRHRDSNPKKRGSVNVVGRLAPLLGPGNSPPSHLPKTRKKYVLSLSRMNEKSLAYVRLYMNNIAAQRETLRDEVKGCYTVICSIRCLTLEILSEIFVRWSDAPTVPQPLTSDCYPIHHAFGPNVAFFSRYQKSQMTPFIPRRNSYRVRDLTPCYSKPWAILQSYPPRIYRRK